MKSWSKQLLVLKDGGREEPAFVQSLNAHSREEPVSVQGLNAHPREEPTSVQSLNTYSREKSISVQGLNTHSREELASVQSLNAYSWGWALAPFLPSLPNGVLGDLSSEVWQSGPHTFEDDTC